MTSLDSRIRNLQNLYFKWQKDNPSLKIDIDACKSRIEMLNNVFLMWLKRKSDQYDYDSYKDTFATAMNFLTGVDDKIMDRQKAEERKERMKKKLQNG